MIRQRSMALLIVVVVVLGLNACAEDASKASSPAVTTAPAEAPPPPAAQEPATTAPRPPGPLTSGVPAPVSPTVASSPNPEEFVDHPALKDVFFDPGKADIGRQGAAIMQNNVRWLVENPDYLVLVEGHTDYIGSREANLLIAERRATAVVSVLVESGIPNSRLHTVSYGEDRPVCSEKSAACAAKNRRVHFRVKRQ
jgi:peptidoglycan-associated lipoprotein